MTHPTTRAAKIEAAARAFLSKVKTCTEGRSYKAMVDMAYLHGWRHDGPDWVAERDALDAALVLPPDPQPASVPVAEVPTRGSPYPYSPVFSQATGWIVGRIVEHVAKPLDREEVERACDVLNGLTAKAQEPCGVCGGTGRIGHGSSEEDCENCQPLEPAPVDRSELREHIAALEHEQWMRWARTLLDTEPGISLVRRQRWAGLFVPYANLTDESKEQDRKEADRILALLPAQDNEKLRRLREWMNSQGAIDASHNAGLRVADFSYGCMAMREHIAREADRLLADGECATDTVYSGVCCLGTKGCDRYHGDPVSESCATCRYWRAEDENHLSKCCKSAQTYVKGKDEWCGDWRAKK